MGTAEGHWEGQGGRGIEVSEGNRRDRSSGCLGRLEWTLGYRAGSKHKKKTWSDQGESEIRGDQMKEEIMSAWVTVILRVPDIRKDQWSRREIIQEWCGRICKRREGLDRLWLGQSPRTDYFRKPMMKEDGAWEGKPSCKQVHDGTLGCGQRWPGS